MDLREEKMPYRINKERERTYLFALIPSLLALTALCLLSFYTYGIVILCILLLVFIPLFIIASILYLVEKEVKKKNGVKWERYVTGMIEARRGRRR